MTEILQKKLYNDKVIVNFYPNSHFYKINNERKISVTAITGIIDKSRPLIYWAVGLMRDYLNEQLENGEIINSAFIIEGSKQHTKFLKKAGDLGTQVHDWCEQFAKAKMNKTELPKIDKTFPKEVILGINAFLDWYNKNKVKFIEIERLVYSKKYDYCGFFDVLAKVNGKICLIDYKTYKENPDYEFKGYPEHKFQVAGYIEAYEEETKKSIDKGTILYFDKITGKFKEMDCGNLKEHRKTFLACLKVKKALVKIA